jgi:Zn-dependent protease
LGEKDVRRHLSQAVFVGCLVCALLLASSIAYGTGVKTQICLVVDGSGSISSSQWKIITQAVSVAINETIPHDGSVELSIVQFGYSATDDYAKVELQPTVIDGTNYGTVAAQVSEIPKSNGNTPTAHGLYLGWSELKNSPNFGANVKQVINLATDGVPNSRNNNATTDLDESGGSTNAKDDVVAVVNTAVAEGLDELDVEGISMTQNDISWLKNWTVRPLPGIVAPPFTKAGWIRAVADPEEFASTIGQKMQVIISGNSEAWVPPAEGALFAGLLTVGLMSIFSSLGSAISEPTSKVAKKVSSLLPEILKKWLYNFISSKRKPAINEEKRNALRLTKLEVASYGLALSILTFAFVFAKVQTLDEVFAVLPTIFATSIIVEFVKNFTVEVVARKLGVWTEHHLWYFGIGAFLLSTLAFKAPFASPSRNIHYSKSFTQRSLGLVSATSVFMGLVFAVAFGIVLVAGFAFVGSIGLVMGLTLSFFETLPIPPMNGKNIYDWSRPLWVGLFVSTLTLYMLCLLLLG